MKKYVLMILISLLTLSLFGCEKVPTKYSEFKSIHIESWDEVDSVITDGLFIVYYYSPYCPDCKSIQEAFTKAIHKRGDRYTIYLMISMDVDSQGQAPITLKGVPALLIYEDKVFKEMKLGAKVVLDYIESV